MKTAVNTHPNQAQKITKRPIGDGTPKAQVAFLSRAEALEFNRYGIMAMLLIVIGCLGGVSVYFMWEEFSVVQLAVIAISTVVPMSYMLALMPMKHILIVTAASVTLNLGLILYHLVV